MIEIARQSDTSLEKKERIHVLFQRQTIITDLDTIISFIPPFSTKALLHVLKRYVNAGQTDNCF